MSKETFYFSHDCNARNDEKIIALRMKLGWEGYGLFWALIERLRDSANYMSVKDYNLIAFDLRTDANKIKSIINDFGLFAFTDDGKCFYSERLNKSMELKNQKSEKARQSIQKRWEKDDERYERNTNEIRTKYERNTNVLQSYYDRNTNKVKESKVKESKYVLLEKEPKACVREGEDFLSKEEISQVNTISETPSKSCGKKFPQNKAFAPPTVQEVEAYCTERKNGIDAEEFCSFYQSKGWMVGKNKMKDWKASVITWEKKREKNDTGNNQNRSKGFNSQRSRGGKISAHQLLARELERATAVNNQGENITIDIEAQ